MSDLVKLLELQIQTHKNPYPIKFDRPIPYDKELADTLTEARDEIERLQAENAKLRKHAEAMYLPGDMPEGRLGDFMEAMQVAWNAYRAEFPRE